jgi:hypothetical protein
MQRASIPKSGASFTDRPKTSAALLGHSGCGSVIFVVWFVATERLGYRKPRFPVLQIGRSFVRLYPIALMDHSACACLIPNPLNRLNFQ